MKYFTRTTLLWPILLTGVVVAGCDASSSIEKPAATQTAPAAATTAKADAAQAALADVAPKTDTTQTAPVAVAAKTEIVMYKSEGCECCGKWAEHLQLAGYAAVEHKMADMDAIRSKYGVGEQLASCHTAIVDGYVIEGHVPASDITRLLKERPDVVGLTAPGMPMQSPGMQKPDQTPKNYDVLAFDADGTSHIFTQY